MDCVIYCNFSTSPENSRKFLIPNLVFPCARPEIFFGVGEGVRGQKHEGSQKLQSTLLFQAQA